MTRMCRLMLSLLASSVAAFACARGGRMKLPQTRVASGPAEPRGRSANLEFPQTKMHITESNYPWRSSITCSTVHAGRLRVLLLLSLSQCLEVLRRGRCALRAWQFVSSNTARLSDMRPLQAAFKTVQGARSAGVFGLGHKRQPGRDLGCLLLFRSSLPRHRNASCPQLPTCPWTPFGWRQQLSFAACWQGQG